MLSLTYMTSKEIVRTKTRNEREEEMKRGKTERKSDNSSVQHANVKDKKMDVI